MNLGEHLGCYKKKTLWIFRVNDGNSKQFKDNFSSTIVASLKQTNLGNNVFLMLILGKVRV